MRCCRFKERGGEAPLVGGADDMRQGLLLRPIAVETKQRAKDT